MKTLPNFIRTPMRILPLALTVWLALLPQANAAITPAWKQWAQRPSRVRVDFSMVFKGTTNAITIGDTVLGFAGTNCELYCTSAVASAWITPNKPTRLRLQGHFYDAQFWMQPQQPLNLGLIQRLPDGRPLAPVAADRYRLYVNGVECTGLAVDQGQCVDGGTNWQVEVRMDADQRRQNTRGRDDEIEVAENSAPGDGDWPAIGMNHLNICS